MALRFSYESLVGVKERIGAPPDLEIRVRVTVTKGKESPPDTLFIPNIIYRVLLCSASEYGNASTTTTEMDLGTFDVPIYFYLPESEEAKKHITLTIPLYPEVIRKLRDINSENKHNCFHIKLKGYILRTGSATSDGNYSITGLQFLDETVKFVHIRDIEYIFLTDAEFTKIMTSLGEVKAEWLVVPPPKTEGEVHGSIIRAVNHLKEANKHLYTSTYYQAMVPLRKAIRNHITIPGTNKEHVLQEHIKDAILDVLAEKMKDVYKKEILKGLELKLRGVMKILNTYLHESEDKFEDYPPFEETELAYSITAHVISYLARRLENP